MRCDGVDVASAVVPAEWCIQTLPPRARRTQLVGRPRPAEMAERRERMSAALYKMSPEGRAKAKAFNKMTAGMEVWRLMRKGLAALVQRQTRAALNGWFVN